MLFRRRLSPDRFNGVQVAPWESRGVRAEFEPIAFGSRGKLLPGVRFTAGDVSVQFWAAEVQDMLEGSLNVAEAKDLRPVSFLCGPSAASKGSLAADSLDGVPEDAVVFLVDPLPRPPVAVLLPDEVASFESWVGALPE